MSVSKKMTRICDNIRIRTGGTARMNLDQIAEAIMQIGKTVDPATTVYRTIGTTYPPVQLPAAPELVGYDVDVVNMMADDIHAYIDAVTNGKTTVTKEIMGKDASNAYDIVRYIYANREHYAWQRDNYPKMYAWKSGNTIKYTQSVSPRINEKAYDVPYLQTDTPEDEPGSGFTNIKDQCTFMYGQRWSLSGGAFKTASGSTYVIVPVPASKTNFVLRFKGFTQNTNYTEWYGGSTADKFTVNLGLPPEADQWGRLTADADGIYTVTLTKTTDISYIGVLMLGGNASSFTDCIITIDEPISENTDDTDDTISVPARAVIYTGKRYSNSGASWQDASDTATVIVPITAGATTVVGKFTGMTRHSSYSGVYGGATNDNFTIVIDGAATGPWSENATKFTVPTGPATLDGVNYVCFFVKYTSGDTYSGATLTVDGKSVELVVGQPSDARQEVIGTTGPSVVGSTLITSVSATRQSRTIDGAEYVRYEAGDVEPTVIYTSKDDGRNSGTSITQDGITYHRYPLGDLGLNHQKLIPVFIYANEHGIIPNHKYPGHETKMCALIAARFMRDLASGVQEENPLYKFIRENCMVIVIPVANPFGYNINLTGGSGINSGADASGYMNANRCNINRNYDTPGWDYMYVNDPVNANWYGTYPGSQNETQYIMNTMVESGAVVAMSLHGHSGTANMGAIQGQDPDGTYFNEEGMAKISTFLQSNYSYKLVDYDVHIGGEYDAVGAHNMPDVTCKSPSYITQCGAFGGIVEFSPFEYNATSKAVTYSAMVIENAYAQVLNLIAMWLSDYLAQKAKSTL